MSLRNIDLNLDRYKQNWIFLSVHYGFSSMDRDKSHWTLQTHSNAEIEAAEDNRYSTSEVKKGFLAISQFIKDRDAKQNHEMSTDKYHGRSSIKRGMAT